MQLSTKIFSVGITSALLLGCWTSQRANCFEVFQKHLCLPEEYSRETHRGTVKFRSDSSLDRVEVWLRKREDALQLLKDYESAKLLKQVEDCSLDNSIRMVVFRTLKGESISFVEIVIVSPESPLAVSLGSADAFKLAQIVDLFREKPQFAEQLEWGGRYCVR